MDLKNNEAHASSIKVGTDSSAADEIDLYDELVSFAELSPEEQRVQSDRIAEKGPESASPEPRRREPLDTLEAPHKDHEAASPLDCEDSTAQTKIILAGPNPFAGLGYSGPLVALSPEVPFTGALTRGVCLACGAESGVNDLFCITCGAFVDEAGSTQLSIPTCAQCGLAVSADEIFCPRCGALLPVS